LFEVVERFGLGDSSARMRAVVSAVVSTTGVRNLRRACVEAGVAVMWGLEVIAVSVERGRLSVAEAIEAGDAIAASNRFITAEIVAAFRQRLRVVA